MSVAAAVATVGSALVVAPAPANPIPGSAASLDVAADVSSAPASTPAPWFGMTVTTGSIGLWKAPAMPVGAPTIAARAGILVDMDDGEILWQRRPHVALPPASLTKVLTSLVALENFSPTQEVTVTRGALLQSGDDSIMGLRVEERLTVQELLEGMLLPSGDDAASAIAVDTVGEARFVAAMNAQVAALGLHDSHFANSSGLDDPDLEASAYDLAVIATFTYDRYPLFDQIVDTRSIDLPATADHPAFRLHNVNQLLEEDPAAVGIKPGWTGNAGWCLIGMAVQHGHRLLAVLLGAGNAPKEETRLLTWGFTVKGLPVMATATPAPG
jgi:D-alanyl-D-alanine carboxypeptidase (penicillin-binding protein 5/6)